MYNFVALLLAYATLSCAATCPDGNLLKNGGFEAHHNSVKPWSTQGDGAKIIRPGHHSKQSAGVSAATPHDAGFLQDIKTCSNVSTYLFEMDHLFSSPIFETDDSGFADVMLGNIQIVLNGGPDDNGTWVTNKQLVHIPSSSRHIIDIGLDNTSKGGTVQIDNVKITAFGDVAAKPGSKNVVKNPGFEASTLGPWHANSEKCALVSPGAFGKPGQAVECTRLASVTQVIDTVPGQLYELTFDYNLMLLNPNSGSVDEVCFTDFHFGNKYQYRGPSLAAPFARNNTWSRVQQPVYADSDQTNLVLKGGSSSGTEYGTCQFLFDNVSLTEAEKAPE